MSYTVSVLHGNPENSMPCRTVNQKALDQFASSQDQRAELATRQEDDRKGFHVPFY